MFSKSILAVIVGLLGLAVAHPCETNPAGCPETCDPIVGNNNCLWPYSQNCIYPDPTLSHKSYCACAPGYKAKGAANDDNTQHWRLNIPGHEHRVWVEQGVECSELCTNPHPDVCGEVKMLDPTCFP